MIVLRKILWGDKFRRLLSSFEPLPNVNVLLLGQDPYPGEGQVVLLCRHRLDNRLPAMNGDLFNEEDQHSGDDDEQHVKP